VVKLAPSPDWVALRAARTILSSTLVRAAVLVAAAVAIWLWGWGFERSAVLDPLSVRENGGFAYWTGGRPAFWAGLATCWSAGRSRTGLLSRSGTRAGRRAYRSCVSSRMAARFLPHIAHMNPYARAAVDGTRIGVVGSTSPPATIPIRAQTDERTAPSIACVCLRSLPCRCLLWLSWCWRVRAGNSRALTCKVRAYVICDLASAGLRTCCPAF